MLFMKKSTTTSGCRSERDRESTDDQRGVIAPIRLGGAQAGVARARQVARARVGAHKGPFYMTLARTCSSERTDM